MDNYSTVKGLQEAGTPLAIVKEGTSAVTNELEEITELQPMVIGPKTVEPQPSITLSSMTGLLEKSLEKVKYLAPTVTRW